MSAIRPARVTTPFVAIGSVALAMHVISRTTGSGWLVVVVALLLSLLALAALLPPLALARVKVEVAAPADATAGRPVVLTVSATAPAPVELRLTVPESGWTRVQGAMRGPVTAVPSRRGVLRHMGVEVRSGGPFGLVVWRRRLHVALARPIEVGPAPLDVEAPAPAGREATTPAEAARAVGPDLPRGVRGYVPGDPPRLVSWVATARHGRLMVKEMEGGPPSPRLTLVVDLRGADEEAEEAAARAAGMAVAALRQGREVDLATDEAGEPRIGPVTSAVEVSRRLARATGAGPPAQPADPAGAVVVGGPSR